MKFRILSLMLAAVGPLVLTGCWSRVEINDRAFVTALYVDLDEDEGYEVSLGFPLPNRLESGGGGTRGSGSDGNPYTIVTKTAESIPIAIRKIRSDLTRELSWGHCRVVVVGQALAEKGLNQILEFVARQPDFHTKTYMMVSPGKSKDLSYLTPVFERMPSEVLREFAKRHLTLDTSVRDFLEAAASGGDVMAPLMTIGKEPMLSEKGKTSTWVGTDGAALFKNGKMAAAFDVKEMRAGLWIGNQMKSSMISLYSPTDGKPITFIILKSKASVKAKAEGDAIRFDLAVEAEDDVMSSESDIDLNDPEQIARLQELLSEQLKERLTHAIRKTQSLGIDAFRFSRYVEWRYPKLWSIHKDRWRDVYKNCEIKVAAKVTVKRTGVEKNRIIRYNDK